MTFKAEEKPIIPTPTQTQPTTQPPRQNQTQPPTTMSRETILSPVNSHFRFSFPIISEATHSTYFQANHNSHPNGDKVKSGVTVFAFGGSNAPPAGQNTVTPTSDQPAQKSFLVNPQSTITSTAGKFSVPF